MSIVPKVQRSILIDSNILGSLFSLIGFDNWKKVNDGKKCAFLKHIDCSQHRRAVEFSENLLNQATHVDNLIEKQTEEELLKKRIRLKASVDTVRWLTFQACGFRGHDETFNSKNQGNFLELLKLIASYNDEFAKVILENAPYNSKYTSGKIQKEILGIIANNFRKHIRSEVGDSYFCVMVDESRDESKKEKMAIVLRFVDVEGIIRESFLDLVHVTDTFSLTLKNNLWRQLLRYEFDVSKIRGQGYDGASNMREEWNGLQALVIKDCPYAYYVYCFAHRLQLALVAASKEIIPINQFFNNLVSIINVVCSSSKRHDELQKAKGVEIKELLELGEIKSGKGENQATTLRRAGDTRWGSHYRSGVISDTSASSSHRSDADAVYSHTKSFEFMFILHLVKEVMGKTDILSQALQKKSQDILNAMELVTATKGNLNDYRNNGWDSLITQVKCFCEKHEIDMPKMDASYTSTRYRPRKKDNQVTFEHFYGVDLFTSTLDKQLHELNSRFNDQAVELLYLSSTLVSKKQPKAINIDDICLLVENYYPADFTEQERIQLRVVRLILTLPVSTATTERGFSAMKMVKNRLRNRMSDEFLANNLVVYIEREIAEKFDSKSVIDEFKDLKGCRAQLSLLSCWKRTCISVMSYYSNQSPPVPPFNQRGQNRVKFGRQRYNGDQQNDYGGYQGQDEYMDGVHTANHKAPVRSVASHFVPIVPKNASLFEPPHQNARSFEAPIQNCYEGGQSNYQSDLQNQGNRQMGNEIRDKEIKALSQQVGQLTEEVAIIIEIKISFVVILKYV
ncbi:uncharacterized protein LOC143619221 [Bidens hawaiensis]|uniref:uncharacterized protein LOC143619221 n=1 Tax=Bidens hawaiensis TaxID=980011 RepID=UPI00404AFE43